MARAKKDIAGRHQLDGATAPVPSGAVAVPSTGTASAPLASNLSPPHPCLIELARLLALQAAEADIAAQRTANAKGK